MIDPRLPLGPADLHYAALITLLWQLYERAQELGLPTLATDLVVASNEMRNGPWRHLGEAPGRLSLPFTPACLLVDDLLDHLQAASYGLAARQRSNSPDRSSTGTVLATPHDAISKPHH
jgi:hypothetical protein